MNSGTIAEKLSSSAESFTPTVRFSSLDVSLRTVSHGRALAPAEVPPRTTIRYVDTVPHSLPLPCQIRRCGVGQAISELLCRMTHGAILAALCEDRYALRRTTNARMVSSIS